MALTAQEQAELDALEAEFAARQAPIRTIAAPSRAPGDLTNPNIQVLSPEEEAELAALEQEFSARQFQPVGNVEDKGLLTQALEAVDSYTGVPVRRAIGTLQDTNSLGQAGNAFVDSFGLDPALAPTGKEIAQKFGVSDAPLMNTSDEELAALQEASSYDPEAAKDYMTKSALKNISRSGAAGFAVDSAADITNLLPFVRPALKGLGVGTKAFLKGSAKAAKAVDAFTGLPLVKTGEFLETTGRVSADVVKKTKRDFVKAFRPGVTEDFNKISRIAAENNIPSELLNESHMYGENSVVARYARNNAEGVSDGLLKHEMLHEKVSEAVDNNIRKLSKGSSIPDDIEAGALIRKSYDDAVDKFFDGIGETYNTALALAPDMRLDQKSSKILMSKLNEMERWANKRLLNTKDSEKIIDSTVSSKKQVKAATVDMLDTLDSTNEAITKTGKSQAREVLTAIRIAKNAIERSGGDLRQVYSAMRDVGEVAFKTKNYLTDIPSDIEKFQEIYFTMQRGMNESVRVHLGDDFYNALKDNNTKMASFLTKRGDLAGVIGNKNLSDEKVFQSLIMNGDSKKIDDLQSIISPEAFDTLRATYIHRIVKPDANGIVNFKGARKTLNDLKKSGKLKLVMSTDEMKKLDEVLLVGEQGGLGVLSTSGSGSSFKLSNLKGYMQDKMVGETIVENIKKGTRDNYVEIPRTLPDGKKYNELLRKAPTVKEKSGISKLREASPITKDRAINAIKAGKLNVNQERNERLEKYKKMRGF